MKKVKKKNQVQNSISLEYLNVRVLILIFDFSPSPNRYGLVELA